jgi:hypothetical protein
VEEVLNAPAITDEDADKDDHIDYRSFKSAEERKVWFARLSAMDNGKLRSSKVVCKISAERRFPLINRHSYFKPLKSGIAFNETSSYGMERVPLWTKTTR